MILNKYFLENSPSAKHSKSPPPNTNKQTQTNRYQKHPFPWVPTPPTVPSNIRIFAVFSYNPPIRRRRLKSIHSPFRSVPFHSIS